MGNDIGTSPRMALYIRVSTEEQAKSGYSIPEQIRSLREHAKRQSFEVVEEITDDGYSGATRDRPGLRRIIELAEAGSIETAIAIKRDRWFRKRYYRLMLDEHLKDHGVRLVALDDTGNKIGDGVLDDYAEFERDLLAERSRSGKLSKARSGKIVGGHGIAYGFIRAGDYYEVDEPRMQVVRRIFSDVSAGTGLRTMRARLEADGTPSPRSAGRWNRWFIKKTITSDLYAPHTVEELIAAGVEEDVAARLATDGSYGLYHFQEIPVPVPASGISRETVAAARREVEDNRAPSRSGNRFWELSGGIIRCGICGRVMQPLTVTKKERKSHYYYRCARHYEGPSDRCTMRKNFRAETTEETVWSVVSEAMDDKQSLREVFEAHYRQWRNMLTPPDGATADALTKRLSEIEQAWSKYQHAYEADAISLDDLKARRHELGREREGIEAELDKAHSGDEQLRQLEESFAFIRENVIEAGDYELGYMPPEERREQYRTMGVCVEAYPSGDLRITWAAGEELPVSSAGASCWRRYTPTMPRGRLRA